MNPRRGIVPLTAGALALSSCGYQGPAAAPTVPSTVVDAESVQQVNPDRVESSVEPDTVPPTTMIPFGTRQATTITYDSEGRVRTEIGCLPDLEAETLNEAFTGRMGPLIGWDNPHIYPLGEDRWLWMVQDSYLDYTGEAEDLRHDGPQIQNLAWLQEGNCFTLIHGGLPQNRVNFEIGDEAGGPEYDDQNFLWPLGGELDGDVLKIFWSQMVHSHPVPEPMDGIIRHPVNVWLAEYDAETLERLSFEAAPNDGVFPSYGFAVDSDDEWSYLFGNSNLLNYQREGGYWAGPHSATSMFLARVPKGRLEERPEYWDGEGWSSRPRRATQISQRFWAENLMQPVLFGDQWISVVKQDGFSGEEIFIDVADDPQGPWRTVDRFVYEPRPGITEKNSYHPVILPWSNPDDGLIIVVSENAHDWPVALENPELYRPSVITRPWPGESP